MSPSPIDVAPAALGGHRAAFRLLAALLAVLLLGSWWVAERVAADRHSAQVRQDVQQRLIALHDRLSANLRGDMQAVKGLISVIHLNPSLDQEQFERAARPLFEGTSQLRNIAGAPDMVIRLMAPLEGNEKAVGLDYRSVPAQFASADWARIARQTVLAGPLTLVQGGTGLIARLPVYLNQADGSERFWGLLSAVIDVERLYMHSGLRDPDLPIEVAIRGSNATGSAGPVFFGRPELFVESSELSDIELPFGSWQIAAAPRAGWPTQSQDIGIVRAVFAAIALALLGALFAVRRAIQTAAKAHAQARAAQRQLATVIESAPDAMVIVNPDGQVVLANAQTEKLFGWTRDELLGQSLEVLQPVRFRVDPAALRARFRHIVATPRVRQAVNQVGLRKDGSEVEIEVGFSPFETDSGPVVCGAIRDVTDRKRAEARALLSERRVRTIADNVPALMAQFDREQRFVFANATYADWYGLKPENMIGKRVGEVLTGPAHATLRAQVASVLATGERATFEAEESDRHVRTSCVPERGEGGEITGLFVLTLDITAMKAVETQLRTLSRVDHLTGLPNRRSFEDELNKACARARRARAAMGLMFIDIDRFKAINDSRGHAVGDRVLQEFAQRLKATIRLSDTAARLGGDEFVAILEPLHQRAAAEVLARKIAAAMEPAIELPEGDPLQMTVSIGIGWADGSGVASAAEILATADGALYEAKESGRNTFRVRDAIKPESSQSD